TGADNNNHNNTPQYRRTYDKFSLALTTPALDHAYVSTPQAALGGRQVGQLRGKGLGGSSQTNFQLWTLGAREEFEFWAKRVGDEGWGSEAVVKRVKAVSTVYPWSRTVQKSTVELMIWSV
ncbi:hypothetical protein LTR53_010225, partial [Teratosphaeriaceae sp. CCFEE 6253]